MLVMRLIWAACMHGLPGVVWPNFLVSFAHSLSGCLAGPSDQCIWQLMCVHMKWIPSFTGADVQGEVNTHHWLRALWWCIRPWWASNGPQTGPLKPTVSNQIDKRFITCFSNIMMQMMILFYPTPCSTWWVSFPFMWPCWWDSTELYIKL